MSFGFVSNFGFLILFVLGVLCVFARVILYPILPLFSELSVHCAFARVIFFPIP